MKILIKTKKAIKTRTFSVSTNVADYGGGELGQKMVVNFRGLANSAEKDEKMSIGVEEPRSKMVDNFELNLACLPRTQIILPNPTYRAILIGRRIINYCSSFGREE